MIEKQFTVTAEQGLHARPASMLTTTCQKFDSSIMVEKNGKSVDAKSILGIMALGAHNGDQVTFKISGTDEIAAMNAIESLFKNEFE